MKILLDTNQVLFICQEPEKVTSKAAELMWRRLSEVFVSAAAFWEIDIKARALLKRPPADMLAYLMRKGVQSLAIEPRHIFVNLETPLPQKDPFDWMMMKQAQVEGMKVLTSDKRMARHPLAMGDHDHSSSPRKLPLAAHLMAA